jgi:hypothetical protein
VVVELLICERSAELFLRVEFRNVVVRLCEENVVLCFGKLCPKYHRRVLRFLVVDIGNAAYSTVQGLFLIDLHSLKVFSTRKNVF